MHFKLTHPLPDRCLVAVSGGADSVAALHWLLQCPGKVVKALHVNHLSGDFAKLSQEHVEQLCETLGVDLEIRTVDSGSAEPGRSQEEHWREQRYRKFEEASRMNEGLPVILAHTFDDCLEEYITCTMVRGYMGTIPYEHPPCIRPFRLWKRLDIEAYCQRHSLPWINDPSNTDYGKYLRAKVRKLVVPRIKYLNPGVYNIVEKIIHAQDNRPVAQ